MYGTRFRLAAIPPLLRAHSLSVSSEPCDRAGSILLGELRQLQIHLPPLAVVQAFLAVGQVVVTQNKRRRPARIWTRRLPPFLVRCVLGVVMVGGNPGPDPNF